MYKRIIKAQIEAKMFKGKAIILVGPRQVGKTTLATEILKTGKRKWEKESIKFNCDNPTDRESLTEKDFEFLQNLIGEQKIILIDEAQKVETIGQTIKLLVEGFGKTKQIIATGSSSINLLEKTTEPLTGRKVVFYLYPLSAEELLGEKGSLRWQKELEAFLRFGSYPEVIKAQSRKGKINVLTELSSSYLYKDVFEFQQIRNATVINDLLRALALQIGSQVSYSEIASLIGIDRKTVERYVDLLEKNYIIFRHSPYSKNIRRTISRMNKIYFFDLGIRNAILNDFNELENRNDVGALWENFLAVERLKFQTYHNIHCTNYFLRTYDGVEIDWLEAGGGKLAGFEFKWKRSGGVGRKKRQRAGIDCLLIRPDSIKGFIV